MFCCGWLVTCERVCNDTSLVGPQMMAETMAQAEPPPTVVRADAASRRQGTCRRRCLGRADSLNVK